MIEDDHYIVNKRNAHIDTSAFQHEVRERLTDHNCEIEEALECIYDSAI